jgi:hypothetical protein
MNSDQARKRAEQSLTSSLPNPGRIKTLPPGFRRADRLSSSCAEAGLLRKEGGPEAAFVGDALKAAGLTHHRAGRAVDLGGPFERLGV